MADAAAKPFTIVGRSSSSFTRILRVFAYETSVDCAFQTVRDLGSRNAADYADNPALKLPILVTPQGALFGALNGCRALHAASGGKLRVVWPEQVSGVLLGNAHELVSQAMTTEIALIMSQLGGVDAAGDYCTKLRSSLEASLAWLDSNLDAVVGALPPERDASYFEVALLCLSEHLQFRQVIDMSGYCQLAGFCAEFGARPSAVRTRYHFDP